MLDPTNSERADMAADALEFYRAGTGKSMADACGDIICDILHWVDEQPKDDQKEIGNPIASGITNYVEECRDERQKPKRYARFPKPHKPIGGYTDDQLLIELARRVVKPSREGRTPTAKDCAAFADLPVRLYAQITGIDWEQFDQRARAVSDLIADVLHWCDHQPTEMLEWLDDPVEQGRHDYYEDLQEETWINSQ